MNSKLSNKFKINAKPRKKHCSFTGRALQILTTALQNFQTIAVLTNSTVTAKPMNNAHQRGGKDTNTETCRRNGRTKQGSDRKPLPPKVLHILNLKTRGGLADHEVDMQGWGLSARTTGSRRGHMENHRIAKRTHGGARLVE